MMPAQAIIKQARNGSDDLGLLQRIPSSVLHGIVLMNLSFKEMLIFMVLNASYRHVGHQHIGNYMTIATVPRITNATFTVLSATRRLQQLHVQHPYRLPIADSMVQVNKFAKQLVTIVRENASTLQQITTHTGPIVPPTPASIATLLESIDLLRAMSSCQMTHLRLSSPTPQVTTTNKIGFPASTTESIRLLSLAQLETTRAVAPSLQHLTIDHCDPLYFPDLFTIGKLSVFARPLYSMSAMFWGGWVS
jgi:hypothetical protein